MKPFIYAISGYKNSGKTTLIEQLLPQLRNKGYKVATIKHDGHDFEADVKGTDSYRHHASGAYGTAVFSNNRVLIHKECQCDETQLIQLFPEADIILLEGFKNSEYPKYFCDYPNTIPNIENIVEDIISKMKGD